MKITRRKIVLLFLVAFFAFSFQNASAWGDCDDTSWHPAWADSYEVGGRCVPDENSNESFCESGGSGGNGFNSICFEKTELIGEEYLTSCSEGICNEPEEMCPDPYTGRLKPCWQIWW